MRARAREGEREGGRERERERRASAPQMIQILDGVLHLGQERAENHYTHVHDYCRRESGGEEGEQEQGEEGQTDRQTDRSKYAENHHEPLTGRP